MTICLGKSCSFSLLCVSFVNVYKAGQPVQRCSRICTALVSSSLLEMGFLCDMAQNVTEF